ncbi:pentapeptide repeat-containing protein [Sphaerisporangium album]|uniref:pentapeptide repeat-containing protein n=1 Tax=Sphaerisporangium album TaxID=509200 RepID=UPI0015F01B40|nr:pentapeptide repeat-containing protein [Sphaerisporangium album]
MIVPAPDWARWTLAGTALAGASSLGIAALLGPGARRLVGLPRPLTAAQREKMTVTEQVEAVNAARNTLIQAATGVVVIGGVAFTAAGLWYTAQTLDTAQQTQITDRYTKAVEQLGQPALDVRLGGIYALERLGKDSLRDHQTIYNVLAAFVREHDPKERPTGVGVTELPPGGIPRPSTDIQAALTVIGRRDVELDLDRLALQNIIVPFADLSGAHLDAVDLEDADLRRVYLDGAKLKQAQLNRSDLTGADLRGADLRGASLFYARTESAAMRGANLSNSYWIGAYMVGADLVSVDLSKAALVSVDLRGADLSGANLSRADLRGADLRGVLGVTEQEIRRYARVDETTRF